MSGEIRQYSFSWTYGHDCPHVSSLSLLGYWAVIGLARALPRIQIPCQRESWLDDSTLSVVPIHILAQGYYITVFDAIALLRNPIQMQFPCQYPVKPVEPLHFMRVNSTGPLSF